MAIKSRWIQRYLYDVVRRLPEGQKEDIKRELESLIEDMLEERAGNEKSEEENVRDVLQELGDPAVLAARYLGGDPHVIGGIYYPLYCQILKVVLICVGVGMAISVIVGFIVHARVETADGLIGYVQKDFVGLASIPGALLEAFGATTLVFWILERNRVKVKGKRPWKPEQMPEIPVKKAVISRGDSIAGIVFCLLAAVLLVCAPELIGAYLKTPEGEMVLVPVFNLQVWNSVLPLILAGMALGIAENAVKLISGRYTMAVMWTNIMGNLVSISIAFLVFGRADLWNSGFWEEIAAVKGKEVLEGILFPPRDILFSGGRLVGLLQLFIIFAALFDMGGAIYKTLRYGRMQGEEV